MAGSIYWQLTEAHFVFMNGILVSWSPIHSNPGKINFLFGVSFQR
jgi:hypothetical protein